MANAKHMASSLFSGSLGFLTLRGPIYVTRCFENKTVLNFICMTIHGLMKHVMDIRYKCLHTTKISHELNSIRKLPPSPLISYDGEISLCRISIVGNVLWKYKCNVKDIGFNGKNSWLSGIALKNSELFYWKICNTYNRRYESAQFTHFGRNQITTLRRQYFQMHFRKRKYVNFVSVLGAVCT